MMEALASERRHAKVPEVPVARPGKRTAGACPDTGAPSGARRQVATWAVPPPARFTS